jgi:hypothetical protein
MKTRARRYFDNDFMGVSIHFVVQYRVFPGFWRMVPEPFIDDKSPERSSRFFPKLFDTLDGASKFAEALSKTGDIASIRQANKFLWQEHKERIRQRPRGSEVRTFG